MFDRDGGFTLERLAQGVYTLRIFTTSAEYSPLFLSLAVRAGRKDTLGLPLKPEYNGIPVVSGMAVAYDTLAGKVRLSWNAAEYDFLEEYLIYRSPAGAVGAVEVQVGRSRDTSFSDSIFPPSDYLSETEKGYEYSVRIKNLSGQVGLRFGSVEVFAAPPASIRTLATLEPEGDGRVGIQDSIRLDLRYRNPGRRIRKVEWYSDGDLIRERADSSLSGEDFIRIAWREPGVKEMRAVLTDEGGVFVFASTQVQVLLDAPEAMAGSETTVAVRSDIRLKGRATDGFGTIRKLEWDIGATGNFVEVAGGDTLVRAPSEPAIGYSCILRATDNRGLTGLDTMRINVVLDPPVADAGRDTMAAQGGQVRLSGRGSDGLGQVRDIEWDIGATGGFSMVPDGDTLITVPAFADSAFLCILRVTDTTDVSALDTIRLWVGPWNLFGNSRIEPRHMAAAGENLIAVSQNGHTEEFESSEGKWYIRNAPYRIRNMQVFGETVLSYSNDKRTEIWNAAEHSWDNYGRHDLSGDIPLHFESDGTYGFALRGSTMFLTGPTLSTFHQRHLTRDNGISDNNWSSVNELPSTLKRSGGLLFYAFGRDVWGSNVPWVDTYDTLTGQWSAAPDRPASGPVHGSYTHGGKWYVMADNGRLEAYDPDSQAWTLKSAVPGWAYPYRPAESRTYLFVKGDRAYVLTRKSSLVEIWSYDISADTWTKEPSFPAQPGGWSVHQTVSGRLFILNGLQLLEVITD